MWRRPNLIGGSIFFLAMAGLFVYVRTFVHGPFPILSPSGSVAMSERDLILIATSLMLLIVIPVFILTFVIAWRYRATNTKARYAPNWEHNKIEEFIWWAVPCVIVLLLANITWTSTHELDPYRPLQSEIPPITIQVVALNWKWLFIYPEYGIASVNALQFPEKTPLNFQITADAPMNSFWIPALGGQIYAMAGMVTQLHLIANSRGEYKGLSANFSGDGFAGMKFTAKAVTSAEFNTWVSGLKSAPGTVLNLDEYNRLAHPSENEVARYYSSVDDALYTDIVHKFMAPPGTHADMRQGDMYIPGM